MKVKQLESRTKRNKMLKMKKTPVLAKNKKSWNAKAMIHHGV
jgi:hypothetical protein